MGVRVVAATDHEFTVEAPVSVNHNHLQTAFGGSINAVATLAGYGFLWLQLRGIASPHVVISGSSIKFLRPVRETIRATCSAPDAKELAGFRSALQQKGKARINLRVAVHEKGAVAAEFTGTFVAQGS
jgi:thioesterase domain-containing protein